jgi:putative transposase
MSERRTKRISYDAEGEIHEYTFSTYRRQPFLTDDEFKRMFLQNLDRARKKHGFLVWAYVLMPEHVHLLIPAQSALTKDILSSIKQPFAKRIVAKLKNENPELLRKMVSGAKRGNSPFSFWQVGGGYDRNVHGAREAWDCIHYIHWNPVRRGLVERPEDLAWSSARFYKELPPCEFEVDRCEVWIL